LYAESAARRSVARIRLYLDEHISRAVARGLRARGADIVTVIEAGTRSATDEEHLERALGEGRTILTQDADFLRLHAAGAQHAGIFSAPPAASTRRILRGLLLALEVLDVEEMRGHVEFL
jgi:uncharacterized protein with PIN domain